MSSPFSRRGFITLAASVAALSACGADDSTGGGDKPLVFASTIVWSSIAQAVGGDRVEVFSPITSPEQDPHEYEASAQDKLRMSTATLAVLNGGGYDGWATQLLDSLDKKPPVVDAFVVGTFAKDDNEHVFYDMHVAKNVAAEVAARLGEIDQANKQAYLDNATAFAGTVDAVLKKATDWSRKNKGAKAVSTESVAEYLLQDLAITDVTPPEFIRQSESESGPSVAVVEKTRNLVGSTATILVVNGQTEDPISKRLVERATQTRAKIVKVYETFPEGVNDYVTFMDRAISSITA